MIFWIASYPKSGNTWVRSFLSAYYFSQDGKFNFDLLKNIKQFPSKEFFNKKIENIEDAAENWLIPQREIKIKNKSCFLKTHNVYGSYRGKPFTTNEFTAGAIIIVRDPRNVITSLMNHYSINEDSALKMISSIHRNLRDINNEEDYSNYSFISSWSNNYNSWKSAKNINKILIKYEELENNTDKIFSDIINFINSITKKKGIINKEKFKNSIRSTSFDILRKKEREDGFDEAVYSDEEGKKKTFFNLGRENNYKILLKKKTINSIEKLFSKEMEELGYL